MGLRDIGATLPPGFRFYPSDEELVCHYLYKKITNEQVLKGTLVEIDLHTCEPWQLPEVAKLNATEWYFFSFRDRKYATGYRTNRATISGYWKATGKDRTVLEPVTREIVGMRKTLVFYRNRAPNGIKTGWIMHEFRMESPHMPPKEDWVLCRIFHKDKQLESTENNSHMKLSPQHMLETIPFASPLNFSPPIQQSNNMQLDASGFDQFSSFCTTPPHQDHHHHHHQTHINQNSTITTTTTTSLLNLLQFSYEKNTTPINNPNITEMMNSRNNEDNDQYGFLWDMDLEDTSGLENMGAAHVSSHLDDMRFEIDNSMVFL